MTYTPEDEMWDRWYEHWDRELYPDHRNDAIEEFTTERLQSFYRANPDVAASAALSYKEAEKLLAHGHPSAAFVFAVSAIEQFLKVTLLKPVVYGLVHHDGLADVVVEFTLGQTGFNRYNKLLSGLFEKLAGIDLAALKRPSSAKSLLEEATELQVIRNSIIHQGQIVQVADARRALDIAAAVFSQMFVAMLSALGLQFENDGPIV